MEGDSQEISRPEVIVSVSVSGSAAWEPIDEEVRLVEFSRSFQGKTPIFGLIFGLWEIFGWCVFWASTGRSTIFRVDVRVSNRHGDDAGW